MEAPKRTLSFVTSKGNEIWLSSLALAWQKFQADSKFVAQIPENAERAKNLIDAFKSIKMSPNDIDKSIYYKGGAGVKDQTLINNMINRQLQQKYKGYNFQKVSKRIRMDQAILYGAMYKHIRLAQPFYSIPGKIMHFCRSKVPCYQPMQENQRKQVFVVNYTNEENFMIRINLLEKNSQMFTIMSKSKLSMDQVFQLVRKSDDQVQPMTNNDVFKIPQLKIRVSHTITDLSSVRLKLGNDDKRYEIAQLSEHVQLEMIGQQQKDNIEDLTLTVPDFENPKLKQRRMCLKDPFWIILRYKNCVPYFAMFVNKATDCS